MPRSLLGIWERVVPLLGHSVQEFGGGHTDASMASGCTCSSCPTAWVRQESSNGLQFITTISKTGSYTAFGVQGRATTSRDDGQSTGRLQLNNLRAEGTASYCCAKRDGAAGCGAGAPDAGEIDSITAFPAPTHSQVHRTSPTFGRTQPRMC
uniref:Immunoglobulin V-set domain-containing protein n=1 Tax=Phasianus colchicus TaxID=9054 RepID=A0A669PRA5_PHACC